MYGVYKTRFTPSYWSNVLITLFIFSQCQTTQQVGGNLEAAAKVYVACTHGLFAGAAIEKLKKAQCDEIISTETIKSAYSKVKITPVLASLF